MSNSTITEAEQITLAEPTLVAPEAPAVSRTMDIVEIMSILPHRYPFLLIDRIVEMERQRPGPGDRQRAEERQRSEVLHPMGAA